MQTARKHENNCTVEVNYCTGLQRKRKLGGPLVCFFDTTWGTTSRENLAWGVLLPGPLLPCDFAACWMLIIKQSKKQKAPRSGEFFYKIACCSITFQVGLFIVPVLTPFWHFFVCSIFFFLLDFF